MLSNVSLKILTYIVVYIVHVYRPGFRDSSAFQPFTKGEEEEEEEEEERREEKEEGRCKRAAEEEEEDSEGDEMVDIERIEDKEEDRSSGGSRQVGSSIN